MTTLVLRPSHPLLSHIVKENRGSAFFSLSTVQVKSWGGRPGHEAKNCLQGYYNACTLPQVPSTPWRRWCQSRRCQRDRKPPGSPASVPLSAHSLELQQQEQFIHTHTLTQLSSRLQYTAVQAQHYVWFLGCCNLASCDSLHRGLYLKLHCEIDDK